jgi:hypothetical protein
MTLVDRLQTVAAGAKVVWWAVLIVAVLFALLLLARSCNGERGAKAELARFQEAAELREAGFLVAAETTQAVLDARAAEIPALQAEIERLRTASPKVRIVRVERLVTAPARAEGVPRPAPEPGQPCPTCLFAWGDIGQIRIDSVELETKDGVQVAMVAGEAWRLTPAPATRILAGVASAPVSSVSAEPVPLSSSPGFGFGLAGGVATTGVLVSALGLSPPVIGDHLSGIVVVSAGQGLGAIQGGVVWR